MHFEHLWEQAENTFQMKTFSLEEVINNLLLKINLYHSFVEKMNNDVSDEEVSKIKTHLMGEILLTLTQLSYKENINVFQALKMSLDFNNVNLLNDKWNHFSG